MEDTQFHKAVLDNLSDGVYFVDRERAITYWNRGAERLTGYDADEVQSRRCGDGVLNHVDEDGNPLCGTRCPLLATMEDGKPREEHMFLQHRDGHRQPVWVRAAPLRNDEGEIIGAVEVFNDDSETRAVRQRLNDVEELAMSDALTGLSNRRHFLDQLRVRLDECERYGRVFGLLFIDIDHFKQVNDSHGHDVGDRVLRAVAQTLRFGARGSDVVGRWGGEEFVVSAVAADVEALRRLAERLRQLVARSHVTHEGQRLSVTVSIGGTLVASGDTAQSLLARADSSLYAAKNGGRNRLMLDERSAFFVDRRGAGS